MSDQKAGARKDPGSPAPFWLSLGLLPLLYLGATRGGWYLALPPLYGWGLLSLLDKILGPNTDNPDPDRPDEELF